MRTERPNPLLLLLPIVPYILSLALPARSNGEAWEGFRLFVIGICIPPCWLANPLLWIGVHLLGRGKTGVAIVYGISASLLALLGPLVLKGLLEAPCWWAWLASMILLAVAGLLAPCFPNVRDWELSRLRSEVDELRASLEAENVRVVVEK